MQIGDLLNQKYRVDEYIGSGGLANVYRATHVLLDRVVAIKTLSSLRYGEGYQYDWFAREARALARLNHPNIVSIYDFDGSDRNAYYLVLEYVRGRSLAQVVDKQPLSIDRALNLFSQICDALEYVHQRGVIHRDIKTENFIISDESVRGGTVKLIDFGLSHIEGESRLEPEGGVFGTAATMSPEQTLGKPATPASDMYALGVLLMELITGRPPFGPSVKIDVYDMHRSMAPPTPSTLVPSIPVALDEVVLALLEKDPTGRMIDFSILRRKIESIRYHHP
jgi:eukaryotic-like serine/threonine-protein kinase